MKIRRACHLHRRLAVAAVSPDAGMPRFVARAR